MPVRASIPALICAAAALAAGARAQTAQSPPAGQGPEIVVRSRPRVGPRVVSTYPAQGAAVAGGTLVLTVTFDQAMTPEGWSYAKVEGADFPACLPRPRLLADGRTFVLLCSAAISHPYAVALNTDPADGFADPSRRFAPAMTLRFTTTADEPVRPLEDALKAAGLTPADSPVMSWRGHAGAPEVAQAPDAASAPVPPPRDAATAPPPH